jgi:hypothetical protein
VHTVEKVIEETQTGAQNRRPEENIDEGQLRASLAHVAAVTPLQRAEFLVQYPTSGLDPGELDLVIYAGTLAPKDAWLLNSPDNATVRHALSRGWIDRLVSIESTNGHLRGRLKENLQYNYTETWLSEKRLKHFLP